MNKPTIYLDIMERGRFICQIPYPKRGFPVLVDGIITEAYDTEEVEKYVFKVRPSLRNRNIKISFTKSRIINN